MLLKLLMRCEGEELWTVSAGSIVRWHKQEGEQVDYGDHLFDLLVEERLVSERKLRLFQERRSLNQHARGYDELAAVELEAGRRARTPMGLLPTPPDHESRISQPVTRFLVRISSSDRGVLRRICAREGERRELGELVALLTTEVDEPIDTSEQALAVAATFRVLASALDLASARRSERGEPDGGRGDWGPHHLILRSVGRGEKRLGLYTCGGFSTSAVFACVPLIRPVLEGHCCIHPSVSVGHCRSDLILQTLQPLPPQWVQPALDRLGLEADYFQSAFWQPSFVVPAQDGPEEFPKSIVVLSTLVDAEQVLYRHREHGFLVDPGDWWYGLEQEVELSPGSQERVRWFQEQFVCAGRMRVEQFEDNFGQLIRHLRATTGAHVLVFNGPTVCPGRPRHSYQFVQEARAIRRLEFNLALTELSRQLDFPIVDVDRILKRAGNRTQVNWSDLDPRLSPAIAQEAFGIMTDLGVFQ